jgi:hypothetical protein
MKMLWKASRHPVSCPQPLGTIAPPISPGETAMATPSRRRRLAIEALEMRQLMASDLAPVHNFRFPEDSNGSGSVTPVDLLVVINQLNQGREAASRVEPTAFATDINADSNLSPIDALLVLNYLNRPSSADTIQPSSLPIEARVRFLEQWMERAGTDEAIKQSAIETLHVLRLGGRPEWGDRWIDGRIQKPESHPDGSDEGTANPAFPPRDSDDSDDLIHLDPIERHPHIYPWMQRLADAGVSTELLQKLKEQWAADWEAGNDWTIETLRQKLTDAGVDFDAILKRHPELPPGNPDGSENLIQPDPVESDPFVYPIMKRLADAGIHTELFRKMMEQWVADNQEGNPWTIETFRQKLTDAGIDLQTILEPQPVFLPDNPDGSDDLIHLDPIERHPNIYPWMQRLADAGVSTELLQKLKEQWAADWEAGNDWTIDTLRQKLTEAGVDLTALFRAAIPQGPLPWLPPRFAPFPNPGVSPGLIKIVRDIEIPRELLLSLVEEAKVAADAGKPWDALTWRNRLEAEGLDLGSIAALLPRLLSAANLRNGVQVLAIV